jgi:hypothetical protein
LKQCSTRWYIIIRHLKPQKGITSVLKLLEHGNQLRLEIATVSFIAFKPLARNSQHGVRHTVDPERFVCCDNVTARCTENYSINFYVRIILESNPRPVRCDCKRVLQSWMWFNEYRVIIGNRTKAQKTKAHTKIPHRQMPTVINADNFLRNVGYEVKFKHAVLLYTASHHRIWTYFFHPEDAFPPKRRL